MTDIFILIESNWDGTEELSRHYFRSRDDALAKAREMMDNDLPKRRKSRNADIEEGMRELDENWSTSCARLYCGYRIEKAELL